jgi:hypothetical protein
VIHLANRLLFPAHVFLLLFFVDGIGIGARVPSNPFHKLGEASPLAVFKTKNRSCPSMENLCGRTLASASPEGHRALPVKQRF